MARVSGRKWLPYFNSFDPELIMIAMATAPDVISTPDSMPADRGAPIRYTIVPSDLGFVAVARTANGLAAAFIGDDEHALACHMEERFRGAVRAEPDEWTTRAVRALDTATDDAGIPIDPNGTEFQKSVWRELRKIPSGATITYSELAARIGRPQSVRAVAAACGANPIAVVIPCHRVVGKDGSLTGYAWGIDRKRKLLEREQLARHA